MPWKSLARAFALLAALGGTGVSAATGAPFSTDSDMMISLLAEDVAKVRLGKQRRELEDDLRAAYAEYALARERLGADHATTRTRLDALAQDPDLALPVLAARAARYPAGSPYAGTTESHYLGLRTFYANDPAVWTRVLETFARAYAGPSSAHDRRQDAAPLR